MKKNSAFCSVLQGNPAVASPKEQLYEQMTSNPAFTERNIQKTQRLSPRFLSGAKIFGHVSHSTELVRMCLACQHFDFNSTDCDHQLIFANNGKGIHLSVQETSVGQERVTNPKERLRGTIEGLGTRFVKVSARQQAHNTLEQLEHAQRQLR